MNAPVAQSKNYVDELRKAGLRITQPRRVILDILTAASDHPDAMEIFHRAHAIDAGISLATVYRTMRMLEQLDIIQRHSFEGGPSRFEQTGRDHHDHLIDVDSGAVIEFQSENIEKLQQEIAKKLGYDIIHHRLELYGRRRKN